MTVCGVSISASTANIVVLSLADHDVRLEEAMPKLVLGDDRSQEDVKNFYQIFAAMCRELNVDRIAIRGRSRRGDYAGGPVGFKIEGLIQLVDTPTEILFPQTISAQARSGLPGIIGSVHKYQQDAFKTAYACLRRNGH